MRPVVTALLYAAAFGAPAAVQAQEQVIAGDFAAHDSTNSTNSEPKAEPKAGAPAPRDWFGSKVGFGKWSTVTGDWAGGRTFFASHGIEFSLNYTHDASAIRGGASRGSTARGLFMGQASADLEKLAGLHGTTVAVSYGRQRGGNGSDFAGDAQAFSNIDTDQFGHLYEAWVEQSVLGGALRAKVGRVDANTEFAVVEPAADFINASAGFSPTILGLPTYPDPKLSANLFVQPVSWLTLSGGAYAGTFDPAVDGDVAVRDHFFIGQVTAGWNKVGDLGAGKFSVGPWHHSGLAERFDGEHSKGADGWWATFEQRLSGQEGADDRAATGARFFSKYGWAPAQLSAFHQHVMIGLVFDGGFRSGSEDAIGAAVTHVDLSDVPEAGSPINETTFELYYKIKVLGFATIRPNFQYVVHPSGDPGRANAFVATLRTGISF